VRNRLRTVARLLSRNPDVAADTHPYISTGLRKHKFGVPISSARELYSKAAGTRHLRVAGVSVHIGSQITDVAPSEKPSSAWPTWFATYARDGHNIDYVDIGERTRD